MTFALAIALCAQVMFPYLVWFSRWNVAAHLSLGFALTAYVIPLSGLDLNALSNSIILEKFSIINIVGALAVLGGCLIAVCLPRWRWLDTYISRFSSEEQKIAIRRRVFIAATVGIVGITISFIVMGFVPAFADDPFSAKFFKNEYLEPYRRIAYLYRASFWSLVFVIPFTLAVWWDTKKTLFLALAGVAVFILLLTLNRAFASTGVLVFLGLIMSRRTWAARLYILLIAIVFPLGSAAYLILAVLLGSSELSAIYNTDTLVSIIASGATDIADQLGFIEGFFIREELTLGRTMIGALLPNSYQWNPSVWTLTYADIGADISEVVSGGLRLSLAIWGYVNFGWIGVIVMPAASAFLTAQIFRSIAFKIDKKSVLAGVAGTMFALSIGKQIGEFYFLSIHNLPAIFLMLWFGWLPGRKAPRYFYKR